MPSQKLRHKQEISYEPRYYAELSSDDDKGSIASDEPPIDRCSDIEIFDEQNTDTDASDFGEDEDSIYETDHEEQDVDDDDDMLDIGDPDLDDLDKLIQHHDDQSPPELATDYDHRCVVCDAPNAKLCPDCEEICYCSPEHQRDDWGLHGQICRKRKLLSPPGRNFIRAVLLPVGSTKIEERVTHKYMSVAYKTEKTRRQHEYTTLTISHSDVVHCIESKGGEVVEATKWAEHPESARPLPKELKVFACKNYKGSGKTRYLLVTTQRDMKPKELRSIYSEAGIAAHWDPRTYDVSPADISLTVAWLKERYRK